MVYFSKPPNDHSTLSLRIGHSVRQRITPYFYTQNTQIPLQQINTRQNKKKKPNKFFIIKTWWIELNSGCSSGGAPTISFRLFSCWLANGRKRRLCLSRERFEEGLLRWRYLWCKLADSFQVASVGAKPGVARRWRGILEKEMFLGWGQSKTGRKRAEMMKSKGESRDWKSETHERESQIAR